MVEQVDHLELGALAARAGAAEDDSDPDHRTSFREKGVRRWWRRRVGPPPGLWFLEDR
jgi:hypothetical protein